MRGQTPPCTPAVPKPCLGTTEILNGGKCLDHFGGEQNDTPLEQEHVDQVPQCRCPAGLLAWGQ